MALPNNRWIHFLGLLLCITAMLFAVVYLQGVLALDPCPLCLLDRIAVMWAGAFFLIAWLHNPGPLGQRIYGLGALIGAGAGIALAARHIWLQNLPPELVPACGPGLEFMLDVFPLQEALSMILSGSGECADVQWTFLGFTIAEQTLAVFIAMASIAIVPIIRPTK